MADIRVTSSFILSNGAFQRADTISNVEIVANSIGGIAGINRITTGLTLIQRWTCTCLTSSIAIVTLIISAIGVGSCGTALHAEVILQVKSNAGAGEEATSAVSRRYVACIAISIAELTGIINCHLVLSVKAIQ